MKVREAVAADAKGIARVHIDSWKTTYKNIISAEYLMNLNYGQRETMWEQNSFEGNVFVAENESGEIIGFSTGGKERTGKYPGYSGELYAIYILKEYQGSGLGKLLVKRVADLLVAQAFNGMLVLVLDDNPACSFYEVLGAKKIGTAETIIAGKKLSEAVYGWDDFKSFI